jgi:hypothetical protein
VVLVHGEPPAQRALVKRLKEQGGPEITCAVKGQRLEL